jgi:hypothetical protein
MRYLHLPHTIQVGPNRTIIPSASVGHLAEGKTALPLLTLTWCFFAHLTCKPVTPFRNGHWGNVGVTPPLCRNNATDGLPSILPDAADGIPKTISERHDPLDALFSPWSTIPFAVVVHHVNTDIFQQRLRHSSIYAYATENIQPIINQSLSQSLRREIHKVAQQASRALIPR